MSAWIGPGLVIFGTVMEILAILAWLKILKVDAHAITDKATVWDFLLAFLQKAGWVATAGLILVYLGLKAMGLS